MYVYDGSMPLDEISLESVKKGFNEINGTLAELCSSKKEAVNWDVKYGVVTKGGSTTKNEDGSPTTSSRRLPGESYRYRLAQCGRF